MKLPMIITGIFLVFTLNVSAQDSAATKDAAPAESAISKNWMSRVDPKKFAAGKPSAKNQKASNDLRLISKNIQSLKSDVIKLNKDLRDMEEKLLFPSNTRFSVFVSLSSGQFFRLESVKLKIDGKLVATEIFSEEERKAMSRGGIFRLYVTNLNEGRHSATAFFTGVDRDGRPLKRASTIDVVKGIGSEYLELAVIDDGATQEAKFELKQW